MTTTEVTYEEFGRNFIEHVVTPERVEAAIAAVAGDLDVGTITLGPGDVVKAESSVTLRAVRARRVETEPQARFVAEIHLDLLLKVAVAGAPHRYQGTITVRLDLVVRTEDPVTLRIDIEEPNADDVTIDLEARGLRSRIVGGIGNVDDEIRKVVLKVVRRQLASEAAKRHRNIDVLSMVDDAWRP